MAMTALHSILAMGVAYLLVTVVAAQGGGIKFGYSGPNGPENWGSLNPNFALCSSGKKQSPINIEKKYLVYNSTLKSLDRNYHPTNATLINNGFNIQLLFEKEAGIVFIDGKKYTLRQLHWHTPSEHTLRGQRFAVELHLVHMSDDGSIAVVGILYKYGDSDSFIDDLKEELDQLAKASNTEDGEVRVAAGEVDIKSLKKHTNKYYKYVGSLTIPPCNENVLWTILGKVRTVSKAQVETLQAPLKNSYKINSRPLQVLNRRVVELYEEKSFLMPR